MVINTTLFCLLFLMLMDPEQLVDYLMFFKNEGLNEYQDFTIENWLMPTEEYNPDTDSDQAEKVELGLWETQPNPKKH